MKLLDADASHLDGIYRGFAEAKHAWIGHKQLNKSLGFVTVSIGVCLVFLKKIAYNYVTTHGRTEYCPFATSNVRKLAS